MQKVVIADTSCLIVLRKINRLDLLQNLFGSITITRTIAAEYKLPLPNWIVVAQPVETETFLYLTGRLDAGESEAIALAAETQDSLLVIDEHKGKAVAKQLKLDIIGTLGVILKAKEAGVIESVKDVLTELRTQTDFRFSAAIEAVVLKKAGE
ncbi:DUF3368 domain-containing protein [Nibrella saemangeumensis]|uniref:DUF3368 domain-containing protein n=1 Tax=Nibrella saemangeumensis TaxID=1084526 RepID=A0ABP8MWW7_9BACT